MHHIAGYFSAVLFLVTLGMPTLGTDLKNAPNPVASYQIHRNIMATIFWAGEESNEDNGNIPNIQSAWDDNWMTRYGGVDAPHNRSGYFPSEFIPKENPFYIALPYNDFHEGNRKANAMSIIPWALQKEWTSLESMCKNRWVKIVRGKKSVYAQWEDTGPFEYNDTKYVFGKAQPRNNINKKAGIDLSPAVGDYLGIHGMEKIDWQFVDEHDVPDGPWKKIVTTSQVCWE